MKLNVLERITLMGLLPQESSFVTFKILGDLKKELSFSEKELKDFKIEQKEFNGKTQVFWDTKKEKDKDVTIGEQAIIIVLASLKKVDEEGKVNDGNISLFEKFRY
jgi:flagellar hook assembly protein FlgD